MTSIGMALDGALEAVPAGVEAVVAAAAAAGAEAGAAAGVAAASGTVAETAVGLAAGMTPVGWIFTVSTVIGGVVLGGWVSDLFDWFRKRGVDVANAGGSQVLVQWDVKNLHGRDRKLLHGVSIEFVDVDTAVFTTDDYKVHGNVSLKDGAVKHKEYIFGDLAFVVPGLNEQVDGNFIVVNQTSARDETKVNFNRLLKELERREKMHLDE